MPSARTIRPLAASAAIESSLCERTMPGSVQVAISRVWLRSMRANAAGRRSKNRNSTAPSRYSAAPWGALLQPDARRVNDLAEDEARLDRAGGEQLPGCDLLAIPQLRAQHFDAPALRSHLEGLVGDFHHLADFALDCAVGSHDVFAGIENLQLAARSGAPGAGRGIAAADQVVDEIDVVRPVDARLGLAAPALVARLGFVLQHFPVLRRNYQICCLEHRLHSHREEAIEVHRAERVVGTDRGFLLQDHRPFVESVGRAKDAQAGLRLAPDDRPVDR